MENIGDPTILTDDMREYIKLKIKHVLFLKHTDPNKREIVESSGRLNFSCPYCGDSTISSFKRRGNLFWNTLYYHCYNDGCTYRGKPTHKSLVDFFYDFNENLPDNEYFELMRVIKSNRIEKQQIDILEFSLLRDLLIHSIPIDKVFKFYRLEKITKDTPFIYEYLKKRLLIYKLDYFGWNAYKKVLYIFNLDHSKSKVLGFQIRNFSDTKSKYMTFSLFKIRSEMEMHIEMEMDEELKQRLNKISAIFGIVTVDLTQEFTVFEGPIDSFFMGNSIAISGVANDSLNFDEVPTVRYMFDNDIAGITHMAGKLREGKKVFLWGKVLKDNKINENIKDLNDLVKYFFMKKKYIKLNDYFSDDPYDIMFLT